MHIYTLLFMLVFCTSCAGQNKPAPTARWTDTQYEYADPIGASLVIENGFPRGVTKYTDANGDLYIYATFWTRVVNETANPLELKINFPVNAYEPPWLPGKYYQLLVLPDTMTVDKESLFNYGLPDLKFFLDSSMHKPSSLERTVNPKESNGFYVILLSRINEVTEGALRTGLSLKGQNLFYRVSLIKGPKPITIIGEKEIHCGSINLKLRKITSASDRK
jgi:hypothetical protein